MYRHLFVPIDDTDFSIEAVCHAVQFARVIDARISFFHAQPDPDSAHYGTTKEVRQIVPAEFASVYDNRTRELLARAESAARSQSVPCSAGSCVTATPDEAILNAARAAGCDLVFLALDTRRANSAVMADSCLVKLLMRSDLPVLIPAFGKPGVAGETIALIRAEHRALAAVLRTWLYLIQVSQVFGRTLGEALMQSMLRYIRVLAIKLYHQEQNQSLFHILRECTSRVNADLDELAHQHHRGAQLLDELESMVGRYGKGEATLDDIKHSVTRYAGFVWESQGREEAVILPAAVHLLTEADWDDIKGALAVQHVPVLDATADVQFKPLFTRIVNLE